MEFQMTHQCERKCYRASSQLKTINFDTFVENSKSEAEAIRQLVTKMEGFASLAHAEDPSNHTLCTTLGSAVEGQDWNLNA